MTTWLVSDNASSTIGGAGVFAGGESLTLATGTGALFPSPSSGQAFMLRIGTDASHETVTCTGRSGDVLTISALANNWLAGIPVELNFNATLFAALVQRTELGTAASHAATDFDVSGAATGAVASHVIAIDPHGDRAFATSAIETALELVSGAVSSVAGKTGAVTLTHSDLSDWATATSAFLTSAPVASVAGKTGTVTLAHGDLTDWATATSAFLTSAPVASVAGKTGTVTLAHGDLTDWSTATSGFLTSAPVASVAGRTGAVTLTHSDLTDWATATAGLGGGGSSGALVKIAQVVTTSGQSSVTFSSIPGGYTDLQISFTGRVTASANDEWMFLQINGDSNSSNYTYSSFQYIIYSWSGVSLIAPTTNGMWALVAGGVGNNANALTHGEYIIPLYSSTAFYKKVAGNCSTTFDQNNNFNENFMTFSAMWLSTAAITSLVFSVPGYTFEVGSTFTLYGRS